MERKLLNSIKVGVFFEKNIEEKTPDKSYYYFYKPYISVFNLVVGSRKMITVPKNMSL